MGGLLMGVSLLSLPSGAIGPGVTTNPTAEATSCASGVQGCTTYTATQFQVSIGTVSYSGQQVQGQISIDGTACGVGACSIYLAAFQSHVASFGPVSGYTTPSSITFYLSAPSTGTFNGVYTPVASPTTTLTVTLTNYGQPVPNRMITAKNGGTMQTQYTNAQGQATFTVLQSTTYTLTNTITGQTATVSVGTSPATYTFAMTLNGPFSIVSWTDNAFGAGLSSGMVTLFLGLGLVSASILTYAFGSKLEGGE